MKRNQNKIDLSMFEVFTDASMHTVVIIDGCGSIQAASRSLQKDFGYTQEELVDQNVSSLISGHYASAHDVHLEKYRKIGDRKIFWAGQEVTGQHKDGSLPPMYLNVSKLALYLQVIAEVIEIEAHLDWLRDKGCDQVQGFLLARPMCFTDLIQWLNTNALANSA